MVTGVPGHELAATRAGGTGASAQGKRLYRSGPMLTLLSYQSTIRTSKPLSETPHSSRSYCENIPGEKNLAENAVRSNFAEKRHTPVYTRKEP